MTCKSDSTPGHGAKGPSGERSKRYLFEFFSNSSRRPKILLIPKKTLTTFMGLIPFPRVLHQLLLQFPLAILPYFRFLASIPLAESAPSCNRPSQTEPSSPLGTHTKVQLTRVRSPLMVHQDLPFFNEPFRLFETLGPGGSLIGNVSPLAWT